MKEYAATITVRILAGSEREAREKLDYRITDSYTIHSMGQLHTGGTVCSRCGQHHTARSAMELNDGSAPRDVTAWLLPATGG